MYIVAQNAGVILSKCEEGVIFTAFELSATNHAVMTAQGRLRRCFPGPAWMIPLDKLCEDDFRPTLARTLSTMSFQTCTSMVPVIRKSQNDMAEHRDTTHPGLITELVFGFLGLVATPTDIARFWKNTREEVLWESAFLPWRRSPLWLHLRVVMQSLFGRFQSRDHEAHTQGKRIYKLFLVYLFSTVLKQDPGCWAR